MSTNRRMDKEDVYNVYTCTMEYYSVLKRNGIVKFAETLATERLSYRLRKRKTNIV